MRDHAWSTAEYDVSDEVKFHNQTMRTDGAYGVGLTGATGAPAYGEKVYPEVFHPDTHTMWKGGCANWWEPNAFPWRWKTVASSAECDEWCNELDGYISFITNHNPSWKYCLPATEVCKPVFHAAHC